MNTLEAYIYVDGKLVDSFESATGALPDVGHRIRMQTTGKCYLIRSVEWEVGFPDGSVGPALHCVEV